jgi:dihydrofolate synthase/folylpolyglutamate synthase
MTFEESLSFIDNLIDYERISHPIYPTNLDSYKTFLKNLENPEKQLKNTVLIAGTKGKGSTATLITGLLHSRGYKVGLFSSPHLLHIRERISIDNEPISEETFTRFIEKLISVLNTGAGSPNRAGKTTPKGFRTVFEVLTTIAYLYFLEENVDYTVLEVGLGGRLDTTNVTHPVVSVITSVSLDHTDILGKTLSEITREKTGIIRKNGIVVSAPQKKEAMEVIEEVSKERGSRLIIVGRELQYEILERSLKGTRFRIKNSATRAQHSEFFLPLLGDHQVENAAVALCTLEVLGVPFSHLTNHYLTAPLQGRLDIVSEKPLIVLDGAHNPYSAQCLRESIETLFPKKRVILLCSILSNKDIDGIAGILSPIASEVVLTKTNSPRTSPLSLLKEKFESRDSSRNPPILCEETVCAVETAKNLAREDDLILVTGSMYLVGDVLKILTQ